MHKHDNLAYYLSASVLSFDVLPVKFGGRRFVSHLSIVAIVHKSSAPNRSLTSATDHPCHCFPRLSQTFPP